MDVWFVEWADQDGGICSVADSLESAVAKLKQDYAAPYIVKWGELEGAGVQGKRWTIDGEFEAVPGYSTKHVGHFAIQQHEVYSK